MYHDHFVGFCTGTLKVRKGAPSYEPRRGDHGFVASSTDITYLEVSEKGTPNFHVRFVGGDRKEKKYNFVPVVFSRTEQGQIKVDDGNREDCIRLLRLLHRQAWQHVN